MSAVRDGSESSETTDSYQASGSVDEFGQTENRESGSGMWRLLKDHWLVVGIVAFLALGALGAGLKYLEEDARQQMLSGKLKNASGNNQSLLNNINPFISSPNPTPTPQLSKEYIYAGDKLLAVEDANAAAPADLAVWRPSTGWWFVRGPDGNIQVSAQWGSEQQYDKTVPGDYDGDGKTDFSIFRPSAYGWYILYSSNGSYNGTTFGQTGDIEAPADFDGDGKTDLAVMRPVGSGFTWYIQKSSDGQLATPGWGNAGDKPAPADYDGDGKADVAVWRPADKTFHVLRSSDGGYQSQTLSGATSDTVVSFDYDGDGKDDYAIFNAGGSWLIKKSASGQLDSITWGTTGDKEVPNDYDGDGKVDLAVWRPNGGNWLIRQSSRVGQADEFRSVQWGQNGDVPVSFFYSR